MHSATQIVCHARDGIVSCSVLQCVAVCCSVLQCVAVCCSVLQCVALCCCGQQIACHARGCIVCCSVLQRFAACCSVLQCVARSNKLRVTHMTASCHEQVCGGMKRPQLIATHTATHTATPTLHHAAMHGLRQRAAPKKNL